MLDQTSQNRKPGIFLSHSHADKPFVRRLASDLQRAGARVWLDKAEIKLGDSLIQKIQQGIDEMDYLAVVLSPDSVASNWVQREVEIALNDEIAGRRVKVLPLLCQSCELPGFLRGKLYADFTSADRYQQGLDLILDRLGLAAGSASIPKSETGIQLQPAGIVLPAVPARVAVLTWQLDKATFENVVLELFRANDDIPLRSLLMDAVRDARVLVDKPDGEADLLTLLDRLTCYCAVAATHERWSWAESAVKALEQVYNLGFDTFGQTQRLNGLPAAQLWLIIVERIMALGAMFVRKGAWDGVRMLVRRPRQDGPFGAGGDVSWIRHGSAEGANAGLFTRADVDGRRVELSLLDMARVQVRAHPCLRPGFNAEDEAILDSLCQFDFLSGMAAIAEAKDATNRVAYPSFARYYSHRTTPAVRELIENSEIRNNLFPLSDEDLATALRTIDERASKIARHYDGWDGFHDERIAAFIRKHLRQSSGA